MYEEYLNDTHIKTYILLKPQSRYQLIGAYSSEGQRLDKGCDYSPGRSWYQLNMQRKMQTIVILYNYEYVSYRFIILSI